MFAPLTVAQRATSRARESASRTRASIQDAWEEGREVAETLVRDAEEHDGHETPEEAREELEDEYRPLMEGEEGGSRGRPSHGRSASYESALTGRSGVGEETVEKKARSLEVAIAYGCFFILGACILLAWNAEIVAGAYFLARLEGSTWETSYSSWVALTFVRRRPRACPAAFANSPLLLPDYWELAVPCARQRNSTRGKISPLGASLALGLNLSSLPAGSSRPADLMVDHDHHRHCIPLHRIYSHQGDQPGVN